MKFGTKRKHVVETEYNNDYLRNFKEGETKVRFLEEPDEWTQYHEHYTRDRKAFPCTEDTLSCPGCTSDDDQVQRRSKKYGTYVLLVDPNLVLPFKVSVRLSNRLSTRAERNGGTLLNRDYIIIRSGEGLKTDYDADQDEKYTINIDEQLNKTGGKTIPDILESMFTEVWGNPDQFEPKQRDYKDPRPKADDTPPPWETTEKSEPDPDDQEVTEAELRAMNRSQLEQIYKNSGWDGFNEDWSKAELLDAIIKQAS